MAIPVLRNRSSLIILLAFCGQLPAQNPQLNTRTGSRFPTVVFTSVLWSAEPAYYSIAVDATGTATYQSAPESVGRTGVPYSINFYVSDRTRRTIFNVARELDFFRGEIEVQPVSAATDKALTLMYHDLGFTTRLTYSGSSDSDVEELTSIFEEVSETLAAAVLARIESLRPKDPTLARMLLALAQGWQSRSVEFAAKYNVVFEVRSSFNNNPGTIVKQEVAYMEKVVVRGVAVDKDQAKVVISNIADKPGTAAKVFKALANANIMKTSPDVDAAAVEAKEALRLQPEWHFVQDVLMPRIEARRKQLAGKE